MPRLVDKVFAYILSAQGLLVFTEPEFPEVGVQVPAGTVDEGESTVDALWREIFEETGLERDIFDAPQYLGERIFDATPWGKDEHHRRHFYLIQTDTQLPKTWEHTEYFGVDQPVLFSFFWLPIEEAMSRLYFEHQALLDRQTGEHVIT